ncbi:zinc finger, CCHC-type containing protein [Tanacetum coccineum]
MTDLRPVKKAKPTCWKFEKTDHIKRDCKGVKVGNKTNGSGTSGSGNGSVPLKGQNMMMMLGGGLTQEQQLMCKDRCWFKTYESVNDGSILHMRNESTALVYGRDCVDLRFSSRKIVSLPNIVNDNIGSTFMPTSKLNDSILWHARLGHVHSKRMQDMSKDRLIPTLDMDTEKFCYVYLLHVKDEALDKSKVFKTKVELQQGYLIKRFRIDRGGEYIDTMTESRVLGVVVRLRNPKLKTLCERGIECIFVGYVEYSKAFRFYVIKSSESVSINSIIELRDAIFDESKMSSIHIVGSQLK